MMSLFALAVIATYDCETAKPSMFTAQNGKVSITTLGLPADKDKWKFTVTVESGDPLQATVTWPGNPLNADGKFAALPTSKSSLAILAASGGPCSLTDGGCVTQINLINVGADGAVVQLVPSALGTAGDTTIPLLVATQGTCKRGGVAK